MQQTLLSSLRGLLGMDHILEGSDAQLRVEKIQNAMSHALVVAEAEMSQSRLQDRIHFAADAKALWYLRGELFYALAQSQGQQYAKRKLDAITEMFKGLLPEAMKPRPRRLIR